MAIDLGFVVVKSRQLEERMGRMTDVQLADLIAAVFGVWSLLISLALGLTLTGFIGGILPSLLITCAAGINVYRERMGHDGFEVMNHISLLSGFWMFIAVMQFPDNVLMQFSNTFAGMWVGLFSTYAAFLRQNNPDRETVVAIRSDLLRPT